MPATLEAYNLTDAYRAQLLRVRHQTILTAQAAWRLHMGVQPTARGEALNLDARIAGYVAATAPIVTGSQRLSARLSHGYLQQFTGAELKAPTNLPDFTADKYGDTTAYGLPVAAALGSAVITTRMALRGGKNYNTASSMGFSRSGRIIGAALLFAGRSALGDLMAAMDNVRGYERALSDNPCGACMAIADGTILPADVDMDVHDNCRCVAEPVLAGVDNQAYARPTGQQLFDSKTTAQQDALFAGRGGSDKADMLRSGDISMSDLASHSDPTYGPAQLSETPLTSL